MTDTKFTSIAILGGTGKEGSGLARRWAEAGYSVIIGSRDVQRAQKAASEMAQELDSSTLQTGLSGDENLAAAHAADVVVLSVPYSAHRSTLEAVAAGLKGKVLVDLTVPLQPPAIRTVHVPEGRAASLEAQALLGDDVMVVAAFQNVSAVKIRNPRTEVDCDVLYCTNHEQAASVAETLVTAAGMRAVNAGPAGQRCGSRIADAGAAAHQQSIWCAGRWHPHHRPGR